MVEMSRGVQAAGRKLGAKVQVYDAHGDMEWDLEVIRQLPQGATDGAILASMHHRRFSEVLFELKQAGFPFVLADQRLHELEVPSVEVDNYGSGYVVGQKVAEMGHRRAAFLGPMKLPVIVERLNGYRDAILDAGILFDRSLVVDIEAEGITDWLNLQLEAVEEAVLRLLDSANVPTVIFDGSGDAAPVIYRAIKRRGLRIPEDISVVTFDDAATYSRYLEPPVTQLRFNWEEVGRIALKMLTSEIGRAKRNGAADAPRAHEKVAGEWVPGESLGKAADPGPAGDGRQA